MSSEPIVRRRSVKCLEAATPNSGACVIERRAPRWRGWNLGHNPVQLDRSRSRPPLHCEDTHVVSVARQASGCLPEPPLPATLIDWVDGVDDERGALRTNTCACPPSPETHGDTPLNQMVSVRIKRRTVIKYCVERRVGCTLTILVAPTLFLRSMRPWAMVETPCELAKVTAYE